MGKKLPTTPRGKVRAALRQLSLRSRERSLALKMADYRCQRCGKKQSRAKNKEVYVEAHHRNGVANWEKLIDLVYEMLLVSPDLWEVLCKDCHQKEHEKKEEITVGCFDTVIVPCPKCGTEEQFQSKGGDCTLQTYRLVECPEDVLSDVNRHSPATCEKCGTMFEVGIVDGVVTPVIA